MASPLRWARPAIGFVKDYWQLLSGPAMLVGGYLLALWRGFAPCLSSACTYWAGALSLLSGGLAGYGVAVLAGRRRTPPVISIEPPQRGLHWSPGTKANVPVAHLSGIWYATNLQRDANILIISVDLETPRGGECFLAGGPAVVPAGKVVELRVVGCLPAALSKPGQPIHARLTFRDNRGRTHRVRARFAAPPIG